MIYIYIYHSLDNGPEVGAISVDISEVFDKIWHKGPILNKDCSGLSGNVLMVLRDFQRFRKQKVLLNRHSL